MTLHKGLPGHREEQEEVAKIRKHLNWALKQERDQTGTHLRNSIRDRGNDMQKHRGARSRLHAEKGTSPMWLELQEEVEGGELASRQSAYRADQGGEEGADGGELEGLGRGLPLLIPPFTSFSCIPEVSGLSPAMM